MAHSEARQEGRTRAISTAQPEDFFQLLKPRVMSLVVFTAATGLIVAQNRGGRHRLSNARPEHRRGDRLDGDWTAGGAGPG